MKKEKKKVLEKLVGLEDRNFRRKVKREYHNELTKKWKEKVRRGEETGVEKRELYPSKRREGKEITG